MDDAIKVRYSRLADEPCCLSCGGAMEKSGASAGEVCVDLGSGRGTDVLRLAAAVGEGGFVYGIDATPGMVEKGRSAARKLGVENVSFIHGDLEEIPIDSESVNVVISNCVINHIAGKDAVWREIHRILKEGGRFVVSDIYSVSHVPAEYSSDPEAVAECWAGAVTREEYLGMVRDAGFNDIQILEESRPYGKGKIEVCSFTIRGYKNST